MCDAAGQRDVCGWKLRWRLAQVVARGESCDHTFWGILVSNHCRLFKHRTHIGANSFIGSNTMLVAPITIGDGAMTATGTVVTSDVPPGAMAVGRAKMDIKEGFWTRMYAKLKARKAKLKK